MDHILASGRSGEHAWKLGIQDPRGKDRITGVESNDNEAIGTSGDYPRYFMNEGKRHPHIIDPRADGSAEAVGRQVDRDV